jgi:hypothetical protein
MPGKPLDNACPGWIAVECRPSTLIATDDSGHPPTLTDLKGAQLQGGAAAPDPVAYGLSPPLFQPLTAYAARGRIFPAPARGNPAPRRLIEDPTSLTALSQTGEPIPDADGSAGRATDPDLGNRTAPDSPDTRHETTDQKAMLAGGRSSMTGEGAALTGL